MSKLVRLDLILKLLGDLLGRFLTPVRFHVFLIFQLKVTSSWGDNLVLNHERRQRGAYAVAGEKLKNRNNF